MMTDDIVLRLHKRANLETDHYEAEFLRKVADEIERLRAKMQEIYDLHHNNAYDVFFRDDTTYEIACEALEMKDE